ncbi:MAG: fasciclin domain-containing protein [Mucilaginibacter sp.]
MMKKIVLPCIMIFSASYLFAQQADTAVRKTAATKVIEGGVISVSQNLMEKLSASVNFSILVKCIKASGNENLFNSNVSITFFAPNNKAFENLPPGRLDTLLLPAHKMEFENLILFHCLAGKITSGDIGKLIKVGNGKAILTTLEGGILVATINENRNIVLTDENGSQSVISNFDMQQSNGVLDVVTAILIPKSK